MSSEVLFSTFGDLAASHAAIEGQVSLSGINYTHELQNLWSKNVVYSESLHVLDLTIEVCENMLRAISDSETDKIKRKQDLGVLFSGLVLSKPLQKALSNLFYAGGLIWLKIKAVRGMSMTGLSTESSTALNRLISVVQRLRQVGLGTYETALAFALSVDRLMNECIHDEYELVTIVGLDENFRQDDLQDRFISFAEQLLIAIRGDPASPLQLMDKRAAMRLWKGRFSSRHGLLKSRDLLDVIVQSAKEDSSMNVLEGLVAHVETPKARRNLILKFEAQLSEQLLRPSVSTVTILDTYMIIIRRLHEMDKSGIILFAASKLISAHLRVREDLVKVILLSLLADWKDDNDSPIESTDTISQSIAKLMERNPESGYQYEEYYEGIDLHDLTWEPEPIEAGTGYRGLTHQDELAHILSLESRDNFVKELQNILGTRLLDKHEANFEKEIRLLELFKLRFEVSNLQASEVMVHDVMESTRTDEAVAGLARSLSQNRNHVEMPEFHARILSKFYWPSLREDTFKLPAQIVTATQNYSKQFQLIKPGRTLEWLPTLGYVVLDLEYADRKIRQECTTWQATVIQQFQSDNDFLAMSMTVQDLRAALDMDDTLLMNGLTFWIGRTVLELTPEGHYRLLNNRTKSVDTSAAAAAAAQVATTSTTLKSSTDLLSENALLYTNFITSMLTNQGGMTADKILMMLKLLIAGGISFEVDELRGLLDRLVGDGTLSLRGTIYKTAKQ